MCLQFSIKDRSCWKELDDNIINFETNDILFKKKKN